MVDRLDYEEWLLERVDAGMADVEAGRTYTREAMLKNWELEVVAKRLLEYAIAAGDDLE